MTVGDRIRKCRENLKLTQEDVAKQLNCTRAAVSQLEGDRVPRVQTLIKLARILKTTASELLGE